MNGLVLACVVAVLNSFTDVSRKKILDRGADTSLVVLWCKLVALAGYLGATVVLLTQGLAPQLPPLGTALGLPRPAAYGLFLLLNGGLEGAAVALAYRALQVSPLSLCVPFTALTPLFLLPAGALLLHEPVSGGMIVGVVLVAVGSLAINQHRLAEGWLGPARSILREKGSRYMVIVALLYAGTATLDKWFVNTGGEAEIAIRTSRALTLAIGKCVTLLLFFLALFLVRRRQALRSRAGGPAPAEFIGAFQWARVWRESPGWVVAAGMFEAGLLTFQLISIQFAPVALVISIKRSSIVLGCMWGWLFFHERNIANRLIGAMVMLTGVTIFFLTKPESLESVMLDDRSAVVVGAAVLLGLVVIHALRRPPRRAPD